MESSLMCKRFALGMEVNVDVDVVCECPKCYSKMIEDTLPRNIVNETLANVEHCFVHTPLAGPSALRNIGACLPEWVYKAYVYIFKIDDVGNEENIDALRLWVFGVQDRVFGLCAGVNVEAARADMEKGYGAWNKTMYSRYVSSYLNYLKNTYDVGGFPSCFEPLLNLLCKQQKAAYTIQCYWRVCISNPGYSMCRRRLLREASDLKI